MNIKLSLEQAHTINQLIENLGLQGFEDVQETIKRSFEYQQKIDERNQLIPDFTEKELHKMIAECINEACNYEVNTRFPMSSEWYQVSHFEEYKVITKYLPLNYIDSQNIATDILNNITTFKCARDSFFTHAHFIKGISYSKLSRMYGLTSNQITYCVQDTTRMIFKEAYNYLKIRED